MNFGFLKRRRAADTQVSQTINRSETPSEPISESNETPSERRRRLDYKRKAERRTLHKLQRTVISSHAALASTRHNSLFSKVPMGVLPRSISKQHASSSHSKTETTNSESSSLPGSSTLCDKCGATCTTTIEHHCNVLYKIKTEPTDETLDDAVNMPSASTSLQQEKTPVVQAPCPSTLNVKSESCVESSMLLEELLICEVEPPVLSQSVNGSHICDIPIVETSLECQHKLNSEFSCGPMINDSIPTPTAAPIPTPNPTPETGGNSLVLENGSLPTISLIAANVANNVVVIKSYIKSKVPNDIDKVETSKAEVRTLKPKPVGQPESIAVNSKVDVPCLRPLAPKYPGIIDNLVSSVESKVPNDDDKVETSIAQVGTIKPKPVGQPESIVVKFKDVPCLRPLAPKNTGIIDNLVVLKSFIESNYKVPNNDDKVESSKAQVRTLKPKPVEQPESSAVKSNVDVPCLRPLAPKDPAKVDIKQILVSRILPFPVYLSFIGYDVKEVTTVFTLQNLAKPLIVQLVDHLCNPCNESGIVVNLKCTDGLHFKPALEFAKSDESGQVNYGTPTVFTNLRKRVASCPLKMCISSCFGVFTVTPRTWHRDKEITGPSLRFHLQPKYGYPSRLVVKSNNPKNCIAGSMLQEFKVSAIAEDNRVLDIVTASQLSMKMWRFDASGANQNEVVITPSLDEGDFYFNGVFTFKKRQAPTVAGMHCIQISFQGQSYVINSSLVNINVLPGKPTMLVVYKPVGTPTVSNSKMNIHSRMIVEQLKVELTDVYKNVTNVDELLSITLLCQNNHETPTFVGGAKNIQVPLVNGRVILAHILLEENCPGVDGEEYLLRFDATCTDIPRPVVHYDLPFVFYRAVTKQQLLDKLTKEHENLVTSVNAYRELFETNLKLIDALQDNERRLSVEVQKSTSELRTFGICETSVDSLPKVDAVLRLKRSQQDEIEISQKNNNRSIIPKSDGVISKVGYLATVSDKNIAEILSRHLKDKMGCLVTYTADKALQNSMAGLQDVLSLDLVNQQYALDIWGKPLPHVHIPGNFQPSGNPVAIRRHLSFTNDIGVCKVVFGTLLGNTILMDTLKDAIRYRQEVVKHVNCPTILTKDGHRIQRDGTFNHLGNSSTSSNNQPDCFYVSAPLHPSSQQSFKRVIEHLKKHRSALAQLMNAQHELAEYNTKNNSTITEKNDEYVQMQCRLEKIGSQLENLKNCTITNDDTISNYEIRDNENPTRNYERNLIDTIMCGLNIPEDVGHSEVNDGE